MWLVHPIMGLAEQWCDVHCIVKLCKCIVSSMVHYYGAWRAMENAHCALYINIWFHITMCNSVKNHFSYNSSALLSWVRKFKEVQLSVSSIHCPLSSTVQHPIKYDSLAEHGAVQRSMRFIAQPYFLLCYFVQFCTVFAVLCSFCSFVQWWAYGTKHLIVWLQCRGVVQQCSAAVNPIIRYQWLISGAGGDIQPPVVSTISFNK